MRLTALAMSDNVSDMKIGKVAPPAKLAPKNTRDVRVTLRLSATDAGTLEKLAGEAGVGTSTMARLIVERYVADYGKRR